MTLVNGLSMPQCSIYQPRAASQTAFLVVWLDGWLSWVLHGWIDTKGVKSRLNPYSRETYTLRAFWILLTYPLSNLAHFRYFSLYWWIYFGHIKRIEWRTEYGLLRVFSHLDLSTLLFHLPSRLLDLVGFRRTTDNINKHRSEIVQNQNTDLSQQTFS